MRFYNRRFGQIARSRRARNLHGKKNHNRRFMFGGYTFESGSFIPIAKAMASWLFIELTEGWQTWFQSMPAEMPKSSVASAKIPIESKAAELQT
jgi:hypothetical protein